MERITESHRTDRQNHRHDNRISYCLLRLYRRAGHKVSFDQHSKFRSDRVFFARSGFIIVNDIMDGRISFEL